MSFVWGLLVGGIVGVLLERLIGHPLDHLVLAPLSRARRRRLLARASGSLDLGDEWCIVAGSALFVNQFVPGGFAAQRIHARVDAKAPNLEQRAGRSERAGDLPRVETLQSSIDRWTERLEADERLWNGWSLALLRCEVSRSEAEEDAALTLIFREEQYATSCAIDEAWMALPLDQRRRFDGNALRRVDPLLCNGFGLNCTIETADGDVLLTVRSDFARGWERHRHISFNEGLSRMDRTPGGQVDIVGAFARGMHEELGVPAALIPDFGERLVIHTLALDVDRYQWGLLAHLNLEGTDITSAVIQNARNLGAAADDWEASGLWTLPFSASPRHVLDELRKPGPWVSHGLLNLALSLAHRHPASAHEVRAALSAGA